MRYTDCAKGGGFMRILRSISMAFSIFSRIPMPKIVWRDENMRYMLCAFPLIGMVIGLCLLAWTWICSITGIGILLRAVGLTLIPVAVTGGFHLDGFMDTSDALASNAPPERKREILKDPHTGAFGVMGLCAYLLLYAALCSQLIIDRNAILSLILMHTLSRVVSGLTILIFPANAAKGLLSTFRQASDKRAASVILSILFVLCAACLIYTDWMTGSAMLAAVLFCIVYLFFMSKKQLGGMSGDLAGYFLQTAEISMLAMIVVIQLIR